MKCVQFLCSLLLPFFRRISLQSSCFFIGIFSVISLFGAFFITCETVCTTIFCCIDHQCHCKMIFSIGHVLYFDYFIHQFVGITFFGLFRFCTLVNLWSVRVHTWNFSICSFLFALEACKLLAGHSWFGFQLPIIHSIDFSLFFRIFR